MNNLEKAAHATEERMRALLSSVPKPDAPSMKVRGLSVPFSLFLSLSLSPGLSLSFSVSLSASLSVLCMICLFCVFWRALSHSLGVQARFPALYKASHPPPPPPAFDSSAEALHLKLPGAREAPLGIYGGTAIACLLGFFRCFCLFQSPLLSCSLYLICVC